MITRHVPSRAAAAILTLVLLTAGASAQSQGYAGKKFPGFTAKDAVTGESFSIDDFRGKVVLIDFWATWCGPCRRELPNVRAAYREYKDRGFEIISVSLDGDQRRFQGFLEREKMPWRHVMEGGGWKTRLARKYGIKSIPAMFLLDHEGTCVSERARGPALSRQVERALQKMERGGGGAAADPVAGARARVTSQLAIAARTLDSLAAPFEALSTDLKEAGQAIDAIERLLPDTRDPEAIARRYRRLLENLAAIRRDMYAAGMFDCDIPTLPADPFAAGEPDRGAMARAWGLLPHATEFVQTLSLELNEERRAIEALDVARRRLENRLAQGPSDLSLIAEGSRQLVIDAGERYQYQRTAWRRQMPRADELLAERADGTALRTELEALELELERSGRDGRRTDAVRSRFIALCTQMLALLDAES